MACVIDDFDPLVAELRDGFDGGHAIPGETFDANPGLEVFDPYHRSTQCCRVPIQVTPDVGRTQVAELAHWARSGNRTIP